MDSKYYWTLESWGGDYPPENADDLIIAANELISAYAEHHDENEVADYSERLWDHYCITGKVEDPSDIDYMHCPVGDPF